MQPFQFWLPIEDADDELAAAVVRDTVCGAESVEPLRPLTQSSALSEPFG